LASGVVVDAVDWTAKWIRLSCYLDYVPEMQAGQTLLVDVVQWQRRQWKGPLMESVDLVGLTWSFRLRRKVEIACLTGCEMYL
jgi:hypothetical protein